LPGLNFPGKLYIIKENLIIKKGEL